VNADGNFSRLYAVDAHGTLVGLFALLVAGIDNRSVWAGFPAIPLALAALLVDQHRAVFVFLKKSLVCAGIDAGRLLTVIAVHGEQTETNVGERPLFPLVHPHIFERTGGDVIPLLARDAARSTARAPALIEEKSVLGHLSPSSFDWGRVLGGED
jgi:hypothetical protein